MGEGLGWVGVTLPTAAQRGRVLRLQELLHVLLEGDVHCGQGQSSARGRPRTTGVGAVVGASTLQSPQCLTFAVGVGVGRAEAHQALPVGGQQLVAGAQRPERLRDGTAGRGGQRDGCCCHPAAPPTVSPALSRCPALTELSVTPRRMTGREKANLRKGGAQTGGEVPGGTTGLALGHPHPGNP